VKRVIKRPIEDFLSAQGTAFGYWLYLAWLDSDLNYWVNVDYAGKINDWVKNYTKGELSFNTEITGSVTEGVLSDGRTDVHVSLHTKNAITYIRDLSQVGSPAIFGHQGWEVVYNNLKPSFADCSLEVIYITTAKPGSPMPDLMQVALHPEPGQKLIELSFSAQAHGELHESFGVNEGTIGKVMIMQKGIMKLNDLDTFNLMPIRRVEIEVIDEKQRLE
jgi:hypothetical protein